jgi:catechol 2,3-dioxygenase-like lactoylglutathione lyase family enzyme
VCDPLNPAGYSAETASEGHRDRFRSREEKLMRVQLALNVRDIDEAVEFYSKLFDTAPAKRKPGYANFAIANPPLKLVLFEVPEAAERLNHLGVEVFEAEEVTEATDRLKRAGLADRVEDAETCCYAKQDKVWAIDPQGMRWEYYRVIEDSEQFGAGGSPVEEDRAKTAPEPCC